MYSDDVPLEIDEDFAWVVAQCRDTPWMAPHQGRRLWDHFAGHRPQVALDIGTHLGVSAAYMATGMRSLGIDGRVITVDSGQNVARDTIDGWADLWARCGVADMIDVVLIADSNYAWWLARKLEGSLMESGDGFHALYDFVYLDGAKVLGIDAAAALLAVELLRPGGWLVMDDLDWCYDDVSEMLSTPVTSYPEGGAFRFSDDERLSSHVRLVHDLVLRRCLLVGITQEDDACNWVWAQRS